MSYTLVFYEIALADIKKHKKSGDLVVLKKIEKLLNELMEYPMTGTGQPAPRSYQIFLFLTPLIFIFSVH